MWIFKITNLKLHSHLPGANELIHYDGTPLRDITSHDSKVYVQTGVQYHVILRSFISLNGSHTLNGHFGFSPWFTGA